MWFFTPKKVSLSSIMWTATPFDFLDTFLGHEHASDVRTCHQFFDTASGFGNASSRIPIHLSRIGMERNEGTAKGWLYLRKHGRRQIQRASYWLRYIVPTKALYLANTRSRCSWVWRRAAFRLAKLMVFTPLTFARSKEIIFNLRRLRLLRHSRLSGIRPVRLRCERFRPCSACRTTSCHSHAFP